MQDFGKTWENHAPNVSRDSSLPFGWAIAAQCWMLSWLPLWGGHLQLSYQLCRPVAKGNCSFASNAADFRLKLSFRNTEQVVFGLVTQCYDNKRFASCLDPQIDYTLSGPIHKFFILRVENISSSIEAVPACVFFIQNNHFRKTSLPNLVTFNAVLKLNDWERAMHLFSVMQHLHPGESDHLWWEGKGWNILKLWSSFLLKMQDAHLKCFFWSRVHCNIYI